MYPMAQAAYAAAVTPASEAFLEATLDRLFEADEEYLPALHQATVHEQAFLLAGQYDVAPEEMVEFLRRAGFMVLTEADLDGLPEDEEEEDC